MIDMRKNAGDGGYVVSIKYTPVNSYTVTSYILHKKGDKIVAEQDGTPQEFQSMMDAVSFIAGMVDDESEHEFTLPEPEEETPSRLPRKTTRKKR